MSLRSGGSSRRLAVPAYFLLAGSALFWGGNFVVGRAVSPEIPPITLNFWRWFGALLILLPVTAPALWRHRAVVRREWRILVLLALTGIGAFHTFLYLALRATQAINAALFMAVIPVVIPAFAFLIDRDVLSRRQAAGLAVSLLGVLVLVARGDPAALATLRFNPGDLWMLASVPLWALYTVLLRRRPTALPPRVFLVTIVLIAVTLLLPAYLVEFTVLGGFEPRAGNLLGIAYVAVFASVVAYIFWNRGVAEIGPSRAGPFLHLIPVFAALLAVLFLAESPRLYHGAGIVLIGIGLVLASGRASAKPAPRASSRR